MKSINDLIALKLLNFFFENPYKDFYLRQLAKELGISPFAAKKYADLLVKEGLIKDERKANLRYFRADTGSVFFRRLKSAFNVNTILKSGLVDSIARGMANVSSIVLFGSMAKGENDEKSDADILVIGSKKHVDLAKFENKIGFEITLHVFSWSEWNRAAEKNKAFYSDIISTGIPLFGEMPLVWK